MMGQMLRTVLRYSPTVLAATLVLSSSAFALDKGVESQSTEFNETSNSDVLAFDTLSEQAAKPVIADNTLAQAMPALEAQPTEPAMPAVPSVSNLQQTETEAPNTMAQVTSVSQLSDVQPTDWAFQALQNLVERYGCIAGYPDGTFRGNRALTRYEFAAGLNACLDAITSLIGEGGVSREELDTLNRLLEEFAAELATLRGRIDVLEARTAELEANQFSTTTKLTGTVIFAGSDMIGEGEGAVPSFHQRVRLNFDTSFTGKDMLRTRLEAANGPNFSSVPGGNLMDRLAFDTNTDNQFQIGELWYRFPLADKITVRIDATGAEINDNVYNFNPYLESSDTGSISRFGRFNPIYRQGADGPGLTVSFDPSKSFGVDVGYYAPNGDDPSIKNGVFNGAFSAMGQIRFGLGDRLRLGATYVRSYYPGGEVNLTGSTGSFNARRPFGNVATGANHYGIEATARVSSNFTISGWAGYTDAQQEDGGDADASIWNWAVTLALPDLGTKGSVLGFVVGMPPKVTDSDGAEDDDTSLHLEAFYRFQISKNISIQPGLFVITNPDHSDSDDTDYIGTIRTVFKF
jgi:hypothetical protein